MKSMKNIMNFMKKNSLASYFIIGAVLGAVLFVGIYGFGVLNFTNDTWLLTGKDLQQHYIGWKFYRDAAWSFPIGLHDGLTHPYSVSVLYTDSIPLFAIFFKLLSPILPETFQYFGLFGLMCYVLNGGVASVLIAKINKNKLFCACGSVFFILSTPVLQRLFGLLTQNSRHTSLAAHFLILGALGVWMYREKFEKYWKAAVAFAVLGILCVLIQMYIIFIVGGIMCGYLLHCIIEKGDWKRFFIVFGSFGAGSLLVFYIVGGFTDVLASGSNGFGLYSANLNALVNPYEYSTFFEGLGMKSGQYEGFSYLGLGMILLCAIGLALLIWKSVKLHREHNLWLVVKTFIKKHYSGLISLFVVVSVFNGLALTTWVYLGKRIILQVYLPEKWYDLLAIVRSSGRFMWVIMYLVMIAALYLVTKLIHNKKVCVMIVAFCLCLQLADLASPIRAIHSQYTSESEEDDTLADSEFWDTQLGQFKHIVYFPITHYGLYQMMQIGTKASNFDDMDVNYFYMSRFLTQDLVKKENKRLKKIFDSNEIAEDTLYILDYKNAHQYKDRCNIYQVDNKIVASKNPIPGLQPYQDVYLSAESPLVELEFSYDGLGKYQAHNGWNEMEYGDDGIWTSEQSVVRILSGGAKKAHIAIEYEGGKKKGETKVKFNGKVKTYIDNKSSGTAEFDVDLKETINEKKSKYINWLFFNTDDTFKAKHNDDDIRRGIYVKKITISYIE